VVRMMRMVMMMMTMMLLVMLMLMLMLNFNLTVLIYMGTHLEVPDDGLLGGAAQGALGAAGGDGPDHDDVLVRVGHGGMAVIRHGADAAEDRVLRLRRPRGRRHVLTGLEAPYLI
jgi:hypothetical protein